LVSTTFTSWRRDPRSNPWGLTSAYRIKGLTCLCLIAEKNHNDVERRQSIQSGVLCGSSAGFSRNSSVYKKTRPRPRVVSVDELHSKNLSFPAPMNSISPDESQSFSDTHEIIGLRAQIKGMLRDPRWHSYLWQSPTDGSHSKCQPAFSCEPIQLIHTSHIRSRHPSDQIWWQGKAV
jgi:hypothetical protein